MAYTVAFPQSYLLESKLLVHLIYSTARTYGNLYSRVKIWLVWTRYLWVLVDNELDQYQPHTHTVGPARKVTSTHELRVKIWLVPTHYSQVLINELDQNNSDSFDSLLVTRE